VPSNDGSAGDLQWSDGHCTPFSEFSKKRGERCWSYQFSKLVIGFVKPFKTVQSRAPRELASIIATMRVIELHEIDGAAVGDKLELVKSNWKFNWKPQKFRGGNSKVFEDATEEKVFAFIAESEVKREAMREVKQAKITSKNKLSKNSPEVVLSEREHALVHVRGEMALLTSRVSESAEMLSSLRGHQLMQNLDMQSPLDVLEISLAVDRLIGEAAGIRDMIGPVRRSHLQNEAFIPFVPRSQVLPSKSTSPKVARLIDIPLSNVPSLEGEVEHYRNITTANQQDFEQILMNETNSAAVNFFLAKTRDQLRSTNNQARFLGVDEAKGVLTTKDSLKVGDIVHVAHVLPFNIGGELSTAMLTAHKLLGETRYFVLCFFPNFNYILCFYFLFRVVVKLVGDNDEVCKEFIMTKFEEWARLHQSEPKVVVGASSELVPFQQANFDVNDLNSLQRSAFVSLLTGACIRHAELEELPATLTTLSAIDELVNELKKMLRLRVGGTSRPIICSALSDHQVLVEPPQCKKTRLNFD